MGNPFKARWTSVGNTLCLGHWEITYQGSLLAIPEEKLEKDMGTFGIYNFMDPDDPLYAEGEEEDEHHEVGDQDRGPKRHELHRTRPVVQDGVLEDREHGTGDGAEALLDQTNVLKGQRR